MVVATFAALSAQAVTSPHFAGAAPAVASAPAGDYAHDATALGNSAKSKSDRASAPAVNNPSLVDCGKLGKASCPKSGTIAPCCQGATACK